MTIFYHLFPMICDATLQRSSTALDESTALESGDHSAFGASHAKLIKRLPNLNVFGGYCGTDHRYVDNMCLHLIT